MRDGDVSDSDIENMIRAWAPAKKKSDKKKSVFSTNRVIVLDLTALKLGLYQKLYN